MQTLCIVGLGYVGLPLAYAFAKKGYKVSGYDISELRIKTLKEGTDYTKELSDEQLQEVSINYSTDPAVMKDADVIIMAIPTPVDYQNNPDLSLLQVASWTVGQHMKRGATIVYESTVYPGVTEGLCAKALQEASKFARSDFKLGYSPERVNPGDKNHTVDKIVKIVAGEDAETTEMLAKLYGSIVTAGIHKAESIKVAEMAKAIENAQRDLNIAFVNEIALLCGKLGIRSKDVFEAAGTKWNFLRFQPGLVGGHCIGVDPYYLVEMAKQLGVQTQVIAAGRSVNDGMGAYVAKQVTDAMPAKNGKVLVLGLTFKENIPDTRNSKSFDVIKQLQKAGCAVEVDDAEVHADEIAKLGLARGTLAPDAYDAILLLVPHNAFKERSADDYSKALKIDGVFFDLKSVFSPAEFEKAGIKYLSL